MASELTRARISRGVQKSYSERANKRLKTSLKELEETEPADISVEEIGGLDGFVQMAQDALNKFEESVIKCLELEKVKVENQSEDENLIIKVDLEDEMQGLIYRVNGLKARVNEERVLARARENAPVTSPVNSSGRPQVKAPPPLPKELDQ